MIIGSCGHEITDGSLGHMISLKDQSREGGRAVSHMSVCPPCYQGYVDRGDALLTEAEEDAWLLGCKHEYQFASEMEL